jgi:Family of unknown function (DUF5990)
MPAMTRTVEIDIEGIDGPGRACPGPDGVAIGIQRDKDVIDPVPSSTESPRFHATIDITGEGEATDFRGPFVHGPKGDRFLYLAWVGIRDGALHARIKLKFADIDPALLAQAAGSGAVIKGRVQLVNAQGKPASGSVRPPRVTWSLGE